MSKKIYSGEKKNARVAIDTLIPNAKNPRRHDVTQIDQLAEGIRYFGQVRPILVRAEDQVLIAGHGVMESCKRAGLSEVDVVFWDVDERVANSYMIADNRHGDHSQDDDAMVAQLIRELEPDNFMALGFADADVDELIKQVETGHKPVSIREVQTHDVEDKFWISVRGPIRQQAKALKQIQALMAEMPDVVVDQGMSELG